MESALRRTGIDVIGSVPWGTHFCQFYEAGQDLIDILVPYFKEGLDAGEFCMWVTSEPLRVEQATAALRAAVPDLDDYINRGQIEILNYSQWYTKSGRFSADEVLKGWVDKLNKAQERGFEGLRLTGNTFWLEKADWDDFTRYEEKVNNVIGRYKMLAICTYCLQKCNALEILDVVANHQFALIKRSGRWGIIESSQHKKTEQALRESEGKLSALYTTMVEGVALHEIVYDSAGNPADYIITDVNPSFEKITGFSRDDSLGKKASALYGTDEPPYLDVYARVASSGKPESFETYFEPMKKHFSISVFSPAQGKFATVFSDITERKLMEKALQESREELVVQSEELETQNEELRTGNEELAEAIRKLQESETRYKSLAENVPSILMRYDRGLRVIYLSPQSEDITGIPTEQFIGKTNREAGMPEDLCNMWEAAIQRVFQTGANQDLEFEFPAVDGSGSKAFYLKLAPEYAPDGDIVQYVLGISTDITERKRAENLLQTNLHRFYTILSSMYAGILLVTDNGQVEYANQAFCDIFDLLNSPADLVGLTPSEMIETIKNAYHNPEEAVARIKEIVYLGQPVRGEEIALQDDRTCLRDFAPIYVDGKSYGRLWHHLDITERKRTEEELARFASFPKLNPNPVVEVDLEGCIFFLNPAAQKLLPGLQEEGQDHPWLADWESVARLLCDSQTGTYVRDVSVGDNWYQQTMYIVPDVQSIRIYGLDITERKRAEIALQDAKEELEVAAEELRLQNDELIHAQSALLESENRLRTLGDNLPESAVYQYTHEADGSVHFLYVSAGIERLNAVRVRDVLQDAGTLHRQIPPEYYEQLVEAEAQSARDLSDFDMVVPMHRPDGQVRWMRLRSRPHRMQDGRIIWDGVQTDVTERKRAEEALRESQALLSAVTEGIPDPIFVKDRESRIIMANPATLRIMGKPLEETIGKNDRELYNDPAIGEAIMANDRRIMDSGQMEVVEEIGQTSDGYRTFLSTKMPYRNSNGEIIGILGITRDITERKRMEEELRKSENQFKVLIDNLSSGVALIDEHGKFTIYNPAFLQMFGLFEDPSNIKNVNDQNWSDWQVFGEDGTLLHVDDHPVRKAAMTGKPVSNKLIGVKLPSGGELVWMLISAEPILKPDGKVDLLICTYHNVTERKQAEEALRETRNYLENLIDYANAPIIVWDTSFRITRFNHAFERLTGLRAAEALGKPLDMLFPEESKEQSLVHIGRTLSGERWDAVEIPILRAGGSVRTILWNSANIYDKDGKMVIATIAQGQDITERKKAEKTLQESEAKYRNLFMNITEEVHFWKLIRDEEGRIKTWRLVDANPPTLKTWGKALDEIKGRTTDEIFGPGATDHYMPVVQKIMTEGIPYFFEDYFPNLDKYFMFTSVPLGDYFITTGADITGIKKVQAELLRARDELEQRVQERTAELQDAKENLEVINEELRVEIDEHERTEKELLKAKDAAEEAVKAKSLFLANMSHELRTPMNTVIGFTGLLLDEPLAPEQKEYLESIRNSGQALLALISDLLDFSRIERENVEMEEQPFDLRSCIEEALDLVGCEAAKKNLDLAYLIDKDMPEAVTGDPARLRQVLVNLLGNAIKYTDEGEAVLSVSSKGQDEVLFEIRDTGIGIPEEKISILFQPFSRVDESFSSMYEGAGLGLAISKRLVEMMGGRIWVESVPGQGSTFSFTIKAKAVPGKPRTIPTGIQPRLLGRHILIVDDNRTNRIILGKQLNSWGMIPVPKPSGQEALALIRGGAPFHAAILDMMMPEMDGIALAREIRKYRKDLPLIQFLSMGQKGNPELFRAVLNKPIKPAQLHRVLSDTLEGQQSSEVRESFGAEAGRSSMRILLAEDNVSNQRVTLEMLKKLGYRADAVANGAEAIQALERQHYDLILMDVKMPVIGGIEATRIIRERWPDNGPKIIAITAYALHGDKEKCLAAGMDGYIPKPVQKEDLSEVLSKYESSQDSP